MTQQLLALSPNPSPSPMAVYPSPQLVHIPTRPEDPPPPPPPPQPPAPSTSMRTMDQTSGLGTSLELTLPTHNPLPPPPNPPPAPITQLPTPRPTTLTTDPSSTLYLENLFGSPSLSINTIPDTPPSQYPKSPVIDLCLSIPQVSSSTNNIHHQCPTNKTSLPPITNLQQQQCLIKSNLQRTSQFLQSSTSPHISSQMAKQELWSWA